MKKIIVLLILASITQAATAGQNMHRRIAKIQNMHSDSFQVDKGVNNKQNLHPVTYYRHAKHHPSNRRSNFRNVKEEVSTLAGVTKTEGSKAKFRHRSKHGRRHFKNL